MRHAKSSWKDPNLSDHDRPLNKRGKRDAPRMGRLLHDRDLVPDLIVSSTAKRARKTAAKVAEACRYDEHHEVVYVPELYATHPAGYQKVLRDIPSDVQTVLLVGHNPEQEEFVEQITGAHERLPTAAIARIELSVDNWSELSETTKGELLRVWRPKELPST